MILICTRSEVEEHWRKTASILEAILPRAGSTYRARYNDLISCVSLICSGFLYETVLRHTGELINLVPLLEYLPSEKPNYWLSWYEDWRSPQDGPTKNRRQFRSSSLVVYAGPVGERKVKILRAEWAGAEVVTAPVRTEVFQGRGAAHPHWHFEGLNEYLDQFGTNLDALRNELTARGQLVTEGLGEEDASRRESIADLFNLEDAAVPRADHAWAGIHLPAAARWAEEEWLGASGTHKMHAFNPASCEQLRAWLASCIRYLQSELQSQLERGRH